MDKLILQFTSITLIVIGCTLAVPVGAQDPGDSISPHLAGGSPLNDFELEAVGTLVGTGGCTATLITQNLVLTAAHCVCNGAGNCVSRATFTLRGVFPVDDPATGIDESLTRTDVSIQGDVRVHPEFEDRGWVREDIAVVELDNPASEVVNNVRPIPVAAPQDIPKVGEIVTLAGYGSTGSGCSEPSEGLLTLELPVEISNWGALRFKRSGEHSCPGDSGGPVINHRGHVVGVASWGNSSDESTYRPTAFSYSWIFNLPREESLSSCTWVEVGAIASHNPGLAWCPNGTFLTQLDLDGGGDFSGHDAPYVGRARCCSAPRLLGKQWSGCSWNQVGALASHNRDLLEWCPQGSFLTQIDLDGDRRFSEHDTPIVGQARCCGLEGMETNGWGSCYWIDVGRSSHQAGSRWDPNIGFLTQFDLDADNELSTTDSPIVGQAKFCRLGLPLASGGGSILTDGSVVHVPALEGPNGDVYEVDLQIIPDDPLLLKPITIKRVQVPAGSR